MTQEMIDDINDPYSLKEKPSGSKKDTKVVYSEWKQETCDNALSIISLKTPL